MDPFRFFKLGALCASSLATAYGLGRLLYVAATAPPAVQQLPARRRPSPTGHGEGPTRAGSAA